MAKIYSKMRTILLVTFCFLLQGCGMLVDETGISGSSGVKVLGAKENRRAPEKNPNMEDLVEAPEIQKMSEVLGDDNQGPYENYKANDNPADLGQSKWNKRKPKLNMAELNKSMDRAIESEKAQQAIAKPVEITAESNLSEVINYNKQQKSKSKTSKLSDSVISSSSSTNSKKEPVTVVVIKQPIELQTGVPEEIEPVAKPKKKKTVAKKPVAKPVEKLAPVPPVVLEPVVPPVKKAEPAPVVAEPVAKPVEKPAPVVVEPSAPPVAKEIAPLKQSEVAVPAAPMPSPESEEDIRNLSHDEFKRSLKEKFKQEQNDANSNS